jgi:hypothetical protein
MAVPTNSHRLSMTVLVVAAIAAAVAVCTITTAPKRGRRVASWLHKQFEADVTEPGPFMKRVLAWLLWIVMPASAVLGGVLYLTGGDAGRARAGGMFDLAVQVAVLGAIVYNSHSRIEQFLQLSVVIIAVFVIDLFGRVLWQWHDWVGELASAALLIGQALFQIRLARGRHVSGSRSATGRSPADATRPESQGRGASVSPSESKSRDRGAV